MDWEDHLLGAVTGATLAVIGGQTPPFTALPEEIVTIPIATIVGGLVGINRVKNAITGFITW